MQHIFFGFCIRFVVANFPSVTGSDVTKTYRPGLCAQVFLWLLNDIVIVRFDIFQILVRESAKLFIMSRDVLNYVHQAFL